MSVTSSFKRLVRFEDDEQNICYGELPEAFPELGDLKGLVIQTYEGDEPWDDNFVLTSTYKSIAKVLSPLKHVPIFYGIGLNYRQHAEEAKFPIPKYPMIFNKPSAANAGPYEDIPIDKDVKWLDYEGELCVIISKSCKNLSESDNPQEYILGYTAGNDISSRFWQQHSQSGSQHGYAKSFDKFAPLGPILVSPLLIPDPVKIQLITRVNGEERQNTMTDDLIFDIGTLIRHCSRGRTLERGTVIMTGTPSGVAAFMNPPKWLEDGDVVEVEISGIGTVRNKMMFEK